MDSMEGTSVCVLPHATSSSREASVDNSQFESEYHLPATQISQQQPLPSMNNYADPQAPTMGFGVSANEQPVPAYQQQCGALPTPTPPESAETSFVSFAGGQPLCPDDGGAGVPVSNQSSSVMMLPAVYRAFMSAEGGYDHTLPGPFYEPGAVLPEGAECYDDPVIGYAPSLSNCASPRSMSFSGSRIDSPKHAGSSPGRVSSPTAPFNSSPEGGRSVSTLTPIRGADGWYNDTRDCSKT